MTRPPCVFVRFSGRDNSRKLSFSKPYLSKGEGFQKKGFWLHPAISHPTCMILLNEVSFVQMSIQVSLFKYIELFRLSGIASANKHIYFSFNGFRRTD